MRKRMCMWDNGGMEQPTTMYTTREHWNALRRRRSMQIVLAIFTFLGAADGVIAFLRNGTGLNLSDVRAGLDKIPGNPLVWFLGITIAALAALLVLMFHETRGIVQQRLDQ